MAVGQEIISSKIANATLSTWPHSCIFEGLEGSGKHTLCNELSNKLKLQITDLTNNIDEQVIENCYLEPYPHLYLIEAEKVELKMQNKLLKFIEEPLKNSYIVILCTNMTQLLPTIQNRCQVFKLQPYTKEYLQSLLGFENEQIIRLARTPGDLKVLSTERLDDICKLVDSMLDIERGRRASVANILTIANKINFDNDNTKFSLQVFIRVMLEELHSRIVNNDNSIIYSQLFAVVNKLKADVCVPRVKLENLFKVLLIQMKELYDYTGIQN